MIHECRWKKWNSKKFQQDDSKLWEFISLRVHENWESWQDFYNVKEIEAYCFHVCFEHITQADNDDKNARYDSQLHWNAKNEIKSHC